MIGESAHKFGSLRVTPRFKILRDSLTLTARSKLPNGPSPSACLSSLRQRKHDAQYSPEWTLLRIHSPQGTCLVRLCRPEIWRDQCGKICTGNHHKCDKAKSCQESCCCRLFSHQRDGKGGWHYKQVGFGV